MQYKLLLLSLSILSVTIFSRLLPVNKVDAVNFETPSVYWGITLKASDIGVTTGDPPWTMDGLDRFESNVNKRMSIYHWGSGWYTKASYWPYDNYVPFQPTLMDALRSRGYIPMYSWQSAIIGPDRLDPIQATISLSRIINGDRYGMNCDISSNPSCKTYDMYVREFANAAKSWNHPFFLRFNWEMNGNWFAWSETVPWNSRGQFIQAWRHVHDIFQSVGATNVTWVWCPNVSSGYTIPLKDLYPGDDYVDWTCLDGYNVNDPWISFAQIMLGKDAGLSWLNNSYQEILSVAPNKPIMIGEFASNESGDGGMKKAEWIRDALTTQIPVNFPKIKAIVWFNWNMDSGSSYIVESTELSKQAFAESIRPAFYAANNFQDLPNTKIQPLSSFSKLGDTDSDGDVDITDYNKLLADFGRSGSIADFNGNNLVDIYDYNILVSNFGR